MSDEMVVIEADITVTYEIPADLERRLMIYGTTDPAECVRIDMEHDPGAFFMDAEIRLGSVGEP